MAVAKRVRLEEPALSSWAEVDQALREIREIDDTLAAYQAEHDRARDRLVAEYEAKAKPLLDRKGYLERSIKEFAEAHKQEMDGKTKFLNFGRVGFRQSTRIVLRNAKAILAALKAKGMHDCIVVKEEISKKALDKYDDAVLAEVGAVRKVEDVFWYEVARDEIRQV